ncbi:Bis(5'-nucleosyl)-tetraphosphatase, symmetrical [BD1-7 clade bacterium]|uniref:Bis(5'-nucleosyl)-tetraphosphatase, symmetrical n=1 Tax=BD1-7 clade bacterium TaxID=2029982 RepID=A0A5S9QR53_9GAMM|nr:Bis(5'-nucleosyl)-tetraphosphatase, symmetrical [BD1-7 clade bacterium]CAA0121409.1 Bis(5'-nucleosyl)-tetraphosphatase, symmetrical [BD1-7 clade bacterium]
MATYAVGDLQGCLDPLLCLLERVKFDPIQDTLWCAGDLVNRGPQSLETLRFVKSLGDACVAVLGNHDLHLLAVAYGGAKLKRSDTLKEILEADDCENLLTWLRHQPLVHHEYDYTLVHAGIPPIWSIKQARARAKEVEAVIQGPDYLNYFREMYGNKPDLWHDDLSGQDRLRCITNYLTRMRFCHADSTLDLSNKNGPEDAAPGTSPWYAFENRKAAGQRIIFGHWAALQGDSQGPDVFAMDTGCVWGGQLTLMRLDDQAMFSCNC